MLLFIYYYVKISAPEFVIRIVCSNCADLEPSMETAVQPSSNISITSEPCERIGSIVNAIPGFM